MLFNVLKILFALIYIPLFMEIFFLIMAPVSMMPRYVTAAPYGVRVNMTNKTYRHTTAEYRIQIRTNAKGVRADREIPYEKPLDKKRVVLLGDSFGMGYGVNLEETFAARMTHYLQTKYGVPVEVVNLSTSGHGNAEQLIVLQNEGFKYTPDLVLLAWHYTDFADNVRSDLFDLEDGELNRKAKAYLPGVKEREFLNQFFIYRFLAENSQIYNFFRNWTGRKAKQLLGRVRLARSSTMEKLAKQNFTTKKGYEKALTKALLERIDKECRANKSRLLILDIPTRSANNSFGSWFPLDYFGATNPLHIVSPKDMFEKHKENQIYWERGDTHFTPYGCNLVGEVIADYIYKSNLLPNR